MKLAEVVEIGNIIKGLVAGTDKFPITVAFKFKKIYNAIEKDIENFEEQRNELFKKYGTRIENNDIEISKENVPDYKKEIDALLATEINDIESIEIKLSEFGNKEVEPKILWALERFIKE